MTGRILSTQDFTIGDRLRTVEKEGDTPFVRLDKTETDVYKKFICWLLKKIRQESLEEKNILKKGERGTRKKNDHN